MPPPRPPRPLSPLPRPLSPRPLNPRPLSGERPLRPLPPPLDCGDWESGDLGVFPCSKPKHTCRSMYRCAPSRQSMQPLQTSSERPGSEIANPKAAGIDWEEGANALAGGEIIHSPV